MIPNVTCPECEATDADVVGVQIRHAYDGVLFWVCRKCNWAWSRDWAGFTRRQQFADRYVEVHNEHRQWLRERKRAKGKKA